MQHEDGLPIWVIYDHPSDYPNCYAARCFIYDKPTAEVVVSTDLEMLREMMIELGLTKLMPMPGDDPVILETWL